MTANRSRARWINPECIESLHAANRVRTEHAALHTVAAARKAVRVMRKWDGHPDTRKPAGMFARYYRALNARVDYPDASLAEIAAQLGLRKDQYSARLRRAIAYAQTLEANA
ncbi:hypothetical protein [Mycobacterium sp. TY814]|uniref:hypothetical protein n=1 Tax=Mycobacterium sp. TY814 TaxID=3050580 RepID=UPI0027419F86|nr:hypothetical protein [Mycobacterium sp. TY814]MDP7721832.1 hypothetical protein [Mycobacterium sp. TY814]